MMTKLANPNHTKESLNIIINVRSKWTILKFQKQENSTCFYKKHGKMGLKISSKHLNGFSTLNSGMSLSKTKK